MPRSIGVTVENNFSKGLITEATGLNFAENACLETYDCIFDKTGEVYRRPGIEFEDSHQIFATSFTNAAITEFVWRGVAQTGEITFFVIQVGNIVSFFRADIEGNLSGQEQSFGVLLDSYKAPGAPDVSTLNCSFAAGNGLLFISHPYCNPIMVEYDEDTQDITETQINLKIRDMFGLPNINNSGVIPPVDQRITQEELSPSIGYNQYNQGWDTFTTVSINNKGFTYNAHTLGFFQAHLGVYPSESEVWWSYKAPLIPDVTEDGNIVTGVPQEALSALELKGQKYGNSPAAKGHFILDAMLLDRAAVSGVYTGQLPVVSAGYNRPSQIAFFAGRVFYAGVAATEFNTKVYFSQILDGKQNVEKCYQRLDPTSEDASDILPTDGGIIVIPEVAKIVRMQVVGGSILIFATNGVWAISGSEGIGFTAVDYNVTRLSSIPAIGPLSFVDVDGTPIWWNLDGIYTIKQAVAGSTPSVESLTDSTIKTFYQEIPAISKKHAKGAFNTFTRVIQWLYRSTEEEGISDRYSYDRILNLDVGSAAFYPWRLPDTCVAINGIAALLGQGLSYEPVDVYVDEDQVFVGDDDVEINDIVRGELNTTFKYLTQDTCENVEAPVEEVLTPNPLFLGTVGGATPQTPGVPTGAVIFGEDNKIYGIRDVNTGFTTIELYQSDGGVGTAKTYAQTTFRTDAQTALGVIPAAWSPFMYCVPVPFSQYFYFIGAMREGASTYYAVVSLYKVDNTGTITFMNTSHKYSGGFTSVPFSADHTIHAVGHHPIGDTAVTSGVVAAMSNATSVTIGGSATTVLTLPSVISMLSSNGTVGTWASINTTNITGESYYLFNSGSEQAADFGSNSKCFFLPGPGGETYLCMYVSRAMAQYHIQNPGAADNNATIDQFCDANPNGFVMAKGLTSGVWTVITNSFGDIFDDLGEDATGAAGDPDYNDYTNPCVQVNFADGNVYIIWMRRFEPNETNMATAGSRQRAIVQLWNATSGLATTIDTVEVQAYDSVDDLGAAELDRYDSYPEQTFAFFHPAFDVLYGYARHDTTHGGQGNDHFFFRLSDVALSIELPEAGLTFAEFNNDVNYLDWEGATGGIDFESYFVTGYKLRGEGLRKFQSNYVRLFTRNVVPSVFDFNSRWDFSNSNLTGRWSQVQRVTMSDTTYDYATRRLKVRGHGLALAYKVTSVSQQPFNIIGWSGMESANNGP
jgi:hypothetical protein